MFYRTKNIAAIFHKLRLHHWLVRAFQIASGYQKCFIHRAGDSLQIGRPRFLNRGLQLDFEVLQWSKLVEIWGTQNGQKSTPN